MFGIDYPVVSTGNIFTAIDTYNSAALNNGAVAGTLEGATAGAGAGTITGSAGAGTVRLCLPSMMPSSVL